MSISWIHFSHLNPLSWRQEIYPSHVTLSEQDKTSLCYLAFPDSNSGCMVSGSVHGCLVWHPFICQSFLLQGDTQFHFRIRQNATTTIGNGSSQTDPRPPGSIPKSHSRYSWHDIVKCVLQKQQHFKVSILIFSSILLCHPYQIQPTMSTSLQDGFKFLVGFRLFSTSQR